MRGGTEMAIRGWRKFFALTSLMGSLMALVGSPVFAQGCVMCKTAAAGSSKDAIRQFNIGILTLLIPAVVLFTAMVSVLYRYRDAFKMDAPESPANETVEEILDRKSVV